MALIALSYLLPIVLFSCIVIGSLSARSRRHSHEESLKVGKRGLCVITGGGAGLGKALAHEYAARGYPLLLVGRKMDRLDAVRAEILERYGLEVEVTTLGADLSTVDGCTKLCEYVADKEVFHLINNAGVGQISADINIADAYTIAATNFLGPAILSTGIRAGRYVFISSPQGLLPMPRRSIYAASKAGIHGMGESIRMDGQEVTIAYPGWIATNLRANAKGNADPNPQARNARSPEAVAREIVSAALSGKRVCCLDTKIRLLALVHVICPSFAEFVIKRALH